MNAPDVITVTWRSEYRAMAHVRGFDFTGADVTEELARTIGAEVAANGALRVTITPDATDAEIIEGVRVRIDRAR